MPKPKADVSEDLMNAFVQFKRLHRNREEGMGRHAIISILRALQGSAQQEESGLKVTDISRILQVTSPTVTQLVNQLEKTGLVERIPDSRDRRVVRVRMTESGRRYLEEAVQAFRDFCRGLAGHLGEERSRQLASLLQDAAEWMAARQQTKS